MLVKPSSSETKRPFSSSPVPKLPTMSPGLEPLTSTSSQPAIGCVQL